jgi:hypothetical protein
VLTEQQLSKLLKTAPGKTFADRRDLAVVRLFVDTWMRCGEPAGLKLETSTAVREWRSCSVRGERPRKFPSEPRQALDCYRRAAPSTGSAVTMASHRAASSDRCAGRGEQAGIEGCIGTSSDTGSRLTSKHGASESDPLLVGWRSGTMLNSYGAAAADARRRVSAARSWDRF